MTKMSGALVALAVCTFMAPHADALTVGPEGAGADIELKKGVVIGGPVLAALAPLASVWRVCEAGTPVITSGKDSAEVHKPQSFHRQSRALDIRGKNLNPTQQACIAAKLPLALPDIAGETWVMIWEEFPDDPARNHFHLHLKPAPSDKLG